VEIVDHDRGRTPGGQVGSEPVEAVKHGKRDVAGCRPGQLLVAEEAVGEAGRPRHHFVALLWDERCQVRLEELADDAVGELLLEIGAARNEDLEADLRCQRACLGNQAGLAHSGSALDRDHPADAAVCGIDDRMHGCELCLALEQGRPRDRNLGPPARRPRPGLGQLPNRERRELVSEAGDDELVEALRLVEVGQHDFAEVAELEVARQVVAHEPGRGARDEHLAAVAGVADSRGLVDGEANVAVAAYVGLARVQTHAHLDLGALGPLVVGQDGLPGSRGRDTGPGTAEDDEERVALGVDLDPAGLDERLPQQLVVGREDVAVAVAPELLQQPRGAFDVGEQERHRARGQAS
jgi:hypothetical protein